MRLSRRLLALGAASTAGLVISCDAPTRPPTVGSIVPRIVTLRDTTRARLVLPLTGVRVTVTGPTSKSLDLVLNGSNWTGKVTGLEPGAYAVNVQGVANGEIQYFGTLPSVNVVAGSEARPSVTFAPAVVTISDPTTAIGTAFTQNIQFSNVAAASGYTVEASKSSTFASGIISVTSASTLVPITVNDVGVWYLRAKVNLPGVVTATAWSDPKQFEVVAAAGGRTSGAAAVTTLASGVPQTVTNRNITPGALEDWHSLPGARAGDSLFVTTRAAGLTPPSALNTVLTLYRSNGTDVVATNDDAPGTTDSRIVVIAPATETYLVKVTASGATVGHYEVVLELRRLPAAPTGLTAIAASGTSVNLAWTDNADNEDSYRIERCTGVNCSDVPANFSEINSTAASAVAFTDPGLTPNETYSYRIRARNAIGNSVYTTTATVRIAGPSDPSLLTATTISGTRIDLTWSDNSNNETGFTVQRCTGNGCTPSTDLVTLAANATSYQDLSAAVDLVYVYHVRAFNAVAPSGFTATATASTVRPSAPTALSATTISATQIDLAWTDSDALETGFRIERCAGAGCASFAEIATTAANATAYNDVSAAAETFYTYRIRASNVPGFSPYSNTASANTRTPGAPSALTSSTVSATRIDLAWTDTTAAETGFRIERCTGVGCPLPAFVEIGTVAANATAFIDATVVLGTSYTYRVRASGIAGNSAYSNTTTANTLLPAAPTGLTASTISGTRIDLAWADVSNNETTFRIERCSGAGCAVFTEIATVAADGNSYSDLSVIAEQVYSYQVRARNIVGNSGYTGVATASTASVAAPTALTATTISATQIDLAWTQNSNNETGFRIERCTGVGCVSFAEIALVSADVVAFQNTGIGAGASYTYRVRSYNPVGASAYTNTATATTSVPAVPTELVALTISGNQINLSWTDASTDETGFALERCDFDGCTVYAPLITLGAGVTAHQDLTVAPGNGYGYRVRAFNVVGNSAFSAAVATDTRPPGAPAGLSATTISGTRIDLAWADTVFSETAFEIERCTGNGCAAFAPLATVGANVSTYSDISAVVGLEYRYQVRATNALGASAYTNIADANTLLSAAPSSTSAVTASATLIQVGWNDNSTDESGFVVERCSGVGCTVFSQVGAVGADVVAFADNSVVANTSYTYRIRATNVAGNSAPSAEATATTFIPAPPSALVATTQSDTRIDLSWTDNADNEAGFTIERCDGVACTVFAEIDGVGADNVSFQNTGLTPEESYTYRIRAFNNAGTSAYSNSATATTNLPAVPDGLTATAILTTQVDLAWNDNASDEDGYRLERCTGAGCSDFAEINVLIAGANAYSDGSVVAATTYRYRLRAYNGAGNSDYSNIAQTTTSVPVTPDGLAGVTVGENRIDLSWIDASDNETSFELERCTGAACGGFTLLATLPAGSIAHSDLGLTVGTIYRYQIRALNAVGPSVYGTIFEGNTILPTAPSALNATTFSISQIDLVWTDNALNETGYLVERCFGTLCGDFVQIAALPQGTTSYSDGGLAPNVVHRYRVRAVNNAGFSAYSNIDDAATDLPADPTGAFALARSSTEIDVTWIDQSNNETGFLVERCVTASCSDFAVQALLGANVQFYSESGLDPDQSYSYRIQAANGSGNSRYSNTASAVTSVPGAPVNLTATTGSGTRIDLAWNDDSDNELGFEIERCTGVGCSDFARIDSIAPNQTAYADATVALNSTNSYRVRAINHVGPSGYTGAATANTLQPFLTSGLTATTISASQIDLQWVDASDNEFGFSVERCVGSGCTDFASIVVVPAGNTTYSDASLSPETVYTYRVAAFNTAGIAGYAGPVEATTILPAAPASFVAIVFDASRIDLTWSDLSNNEQGFGIERCSGNGCSNFVQIVAVGAGVTAYQNTTGIAQNSFYSYRVRSFNAAGVSAYTPTASVNTFLPAAPSGLVATPVLGNRVDLAWTDNANNESGFQVERCTGSGCIDFALIETQPENTPSHADSTLSFGNIYRYRVRATNGVGNSGFTSIVETGTNVPLDPTALGAETVGASTIRLTWTDNATNEAGFRIERCAGPGCSSFTLVTSLGADITSYDDAGLTTETSFTYRVRAFNVGSSGYTNTATATTILPAAPTVLSALAVSGSRIDLAWSDNADNEYGYRVERCSGAACSDFAEVTLEDANATMHEDSTLTLNTVYRYRVRAYNGAGTTAYSNESEAQTNVPGIPTGLTATTVTAVQIDLAWTDNATTETGYQVEQCAGVGCTNFALVATLAADATSHQASGLTPNTSYRFRVRSTNVSGGSGYSNIAAASTNTPADPSLLVATTISDSRIDLSWTDNADNEATFVIQRCTGASCVDFTDLATTGLNSTTHSDLTVSVGFDYRYRVRADNAAGVSNYSNVALGSTRTPADPTGLVATTASATQIDLTWTDNADNEATYRVERCAGPACSDFAEISILPPGTVSYSDIGLTPNTSYTYLIKANNVSGWSGNSTEETATTNIPSDPTSLVAVTVGPTQIDLTWTDNATNELQYRVERCDNTDCLSETYSQIALLAAGSVSYSDVTVTVGSSYGYRVQAVNAAGTSGASSATATTLLPNAPTATSLTIFDATPTTQFLWTDNSDNEQGFTWDRCTGPGCLDFVEIQSVAANSSGIFDVGVSTGVVLRYRVRAFNAAGVSSYSDILDVGIVAPDAPQSLGATTLSESQIQLDWTDASAGETGFRIERCLGAVCSDFAQVGTVGANVTTFQAAGLVIGNSYRFRVRATNLIGNSSYSNEVLATTLLPNAPSALTTTLVSGSRIDLGWADNSDNELDFRIERCTGDGCGAFVEIASVPAGTTTYQSTGLSLNTHYAWRVRALNNVGPSAFSETATGNTDVPITPAALVATAITGSQVDLTWSDPSSDETEFVVEYCPSAACVAVSGWTPITTLAPNSTAFSATGLPASPEQNFRVRSTNLAGPSAYSGTAAVSTMLVAPTDLRASTLNRTTTRLIWSDNTLLETGYHVYRCGGEGCFPNAFFAAVGPNTTSFDNVGLPPGITFNYRVRAITTNHDAFSATVAGARTPIPIQSGGAPLMVSDSSQGERHFVLAVPAGARKLIVRMVSPAGDADMYVRRGDAPMVFNVLNDADNCVPFTGASPEVCTFELPGGGDWFIMLHGFSAYTNSTIEAFVPNDLVVFNDLNAFDNTGMGNVDNQRLATNMAAFTNPGVRGGGNHVWVDRGRASISSHVITTMQSVWGGMGLVVTQIASTSGTLTAIPTNVRLLVLFMPGQAFTAPEVAALRDFMKTGGRIMFVGDSFCFYGAAGQAIENSLIASLGGSSTMDNGCYDAGYVVLGPPSIRADQITTTPQAMGSMTWAYGAGINLGFGDKPIFYNLANTVPWAAVINVTFP